MANNVPGRSKDDTIDSLRESDELTRRSKDLPIRRKSTSAEEVFESCNGSVNWNCSGSLSTGLVVGDCECNLTRALASHETTWQGSHGGGQESERGDDGEDHFEIEDIIDFLLDWYCGLSVIVVFCCCALEDDIHRYVESRGSLYLFIIRQTHTIEGRQFHPDYQLSKHVSVQACIERLDSLMGNSLRRPEISTTQDVFRLIRIVFAAAGLNSMTEKNDTRPFDNRTRMRNTNISA